MQINKPYQYLFRRLTESNTETKNITQFFGSSSGLGVGYGGGKWIAVGNGPNGSIGYSQDGITWKSATDFFVAGAGYSVAYGGGKWVAVGQAYQGSGISTVAYSLDGITWVPSGDFFKGGRGQCVSYSKETGRWIIVGMGENGTVGYSDDGINWVSSNNFFGQGEGYGIAYGGGKWVAVGGGENGNICYSSDNGQTFIVSDVFFQADRGYGVAYSEDEQKWIAVGTNGLGTRSIAFSENAVNWNPLPNFFAGGIGKAVSYGNGKWVVTGFGQNGTIGYSIDGGNTWTSTMTSYFDYGQGGEDVAYSPFLKNWIAVGGGGIYPDSVTIGYSNDGTNFSNQISVYGQTIDPRYLYLLPLFKDKV